jgi:hypothetical protein
VPEVR